MIPRFVWLLACAAFYIYLGVSALSYAWAKPFKNWDMKAYIGAAFLIEQEADNKWYKRVQREIRKDRSPRSRNFREHEPRYSPDMEGFRQHMPFYTAKPLYVAAVYAFYKLGTPGVMATYAVPILSLAVMLALMFFLPLWKVDYGLWWAACAGFLFLFPYDVTTMVRQSSPDGMSLLMTALLLYALMVWKRWWAWYLLSALMVLTRPDTMPLMAILAVLLCLFPAEALRFSWKHVAGTAAVMALVYSANAYFTDSYGLLVFIEFSRINKVLYPAVLTGNFSFDEYLASIGSGLYYAERSPMVHAMVAWTLSAAACARFSLQESRMGLVLIATAWLCCIAKILIFAAQWDQRLYYGCFFIGFIGGLLCFINTGRLLFARIMDMRFRRAQDR